MLIRLRRAARAKAGEVQFRSCLPNPKPRASERLAKDGGEGGIRTPVPVTRQDAFEAPPLRPLRYLSDTLLYEFFSLRSRKNSWISSRHSASSTPRVTTIR